MNVVYNPRGRAGEYSKWALNVYNGCTNGCAYCYVPAIQKKTYAQFKSSGHPRKYLINQLELDLQKGREEIDGPVLMSFTCDPYQKIEETELLTQQCIELFVMYDVPFQVLTKSTDLAIRDFDMYSTNSSNRFATTLTHTDNDRLSKLEPGASSYDSRVNALTKAKDLGIFTWVSLEPVVDPKVTLQIIEDTHLVVDHFKVGKLNHDPYEKTIDWKKFRSDAIAILQKFDKDYYIKKDLDVFR
jgi:DNA repair photolyase